MTDFSIKNAIFINFYPQYLRCKNRTITELRELFCYSEIVIKKEVRQMYNKIIDTKQKLSNKEILEKWLQDKKVEGYTSFDIARIASEEFDFMLLEQRKNYFLQGKLLLIAEQCIFRILDSKACKTENIFLNLTDKDISICQSYFLYVREIENLGRSINEIVDFEPDVIHEIYKLDSPEMYEKIEKFVRENKVGKNHLKNIIKLLQEDVNLPLDVALEQVKQEAKAKREEIKCNLYWQKKYRTLRQRFKALNNIYNVVYDEWKQNKFVARRYNKRLEKLRTENKELKAQLKTLQKKE